MIKNPGPSRHTDPVATVTAIKMKYVKRCHNTKKKKKKVLECYCFAYYINHITVLNLMKLPKQVYCYTNKALYHLIYVC
jgi:hypothetical protein